MHIVHILTRFLRAGSEENTLHSALHQARTGHRVTILHGKEYDERQYQLIGCKIEVRCIPALVHPIDIVSDLRAIRDIRRFLAGNNADIVHTHQSKAGIVGRVAARLAGTPAVVHGVHIVPFNNVGLAQRLVYLAAEHATAAVTDMFIHVSEGTRTAYLKRKIGRGVPQVVVRSGMAIEKFRSAVWQRIGVICWGRVNPKISQGRC